MDVSKKDVQELLSKIEGALNSVITFADRSDGSHIVRINHSDVDIQYSVYKMPAQNMIRIDLKGVPEL